MEKYPVGWSVGRSVVLVGRSVVLVWLVLFTLTFFYSSFFDVLAKKYIPHF